MGDVKVSSWFSCAVSAVSSGSVTTASGLISSVVAFTSEFTSASLSASVVLASTSAVSFSIPIFFQNTTVSPKDTAIERIRPMAK